MVGSDRMVIIWVQRCTPIIISRKISIALLRLQHIFLVGIPAEQDGRKIGDI